jgi:hypothetical protein
MKHCPGCERTLPPDAFGPNARRPDGLQPKCRECRSRDARRQYAAAREHITSRRRKLYAGRATP